MAFAALIILCLAPPAWPAGEAVPPRPVETNTPATVPVLGLVQEPPHRGPSLTELSPPATIPPAPTLAPAGAATAERFFDPVALDLSAAELSARHGFDQAALESDPRSLAEARYLTELKGRTLRLYRRFFPDLHREFPLTLQFRYGYFDGAYVQRNAYHTKNQDGTHEIFFANDSCTHDEETERLHPISWRYPPVARKINMTVTAFHEYAHGIFDEITAGPPPEPFHAAAVTTAYGALTEGFAVLTELLLSDKMVTAREELGLSEEEVADLKGNKAARIFSLRRLRHMDSRYTDGTIYFWHKLYKKEGEAGMLRFLEALDSKRLASITNASPAYYLIQNSPDLMKSYLAGPADDPKRLALTKLANYLYRFHEHREVPADAELVAADFNRFAVERLFYSFLAHGWAPERLLDFARLGAIATRRVLDYLLSWPLPKDPPSIGEIAITDTIDLLLKEKESLPLPSEEKTARLKVLKERRASIPR